MLTLAELLKEKMLGMEKGEGHGCSFGHALYLVAGLLDALRPHIFDMYNSSPFQHDAMYSGLMEIEPCRFEEPRKDVYESPTFCRGSLLVIMDIYFEFLNNLDAVNLAQYLKVVLRLIDFLCHCVAAGKHCLHIVNRHQKLIQTAAQKFPKIKKLGFLLSLIENHDLSVHTARTDADELLKGQSYVEDIQVGPPMLPVDVVLKVQNQLQHFLSLQTDCSDDYSLTTEEYPQRNLKSTKLEDEIDLLSILNDVEKASARVPTLLTSLEEPLIQLIKVRNKDIQTCTYRLLERLLLHCPSEDTSGRVIKALLDNLKSSDISLAKIAAQQAVKFFYHCPELQETVLVELFLSRGFAEEDLQQLFRDLLSIIG